MARNTSTQTTKCPKENDFQIFEFVGRIGISTVFHPFEYVKVLIQIGHEPIPPYPTHTLFGRPALRLPGAFRYIRHIKAVDGFFGLYRGLIPKLCASTISGITYNSTIQQLPVYIEPPSKEEEEQELTEEQKILLFLQKTIQETIARCCAVIASHPLHVISLRAMAQFVGREDHYGGIFGSLYHMIKEEGIRAFFVGLIPRVLGEVCTLWFAHVATFIINTYLIEDTATRSYIGTCLLYLAGTITYPFFLVSNVMAVNNCGLTAGLPPNALIYNNWRDCWTHLSAMGHLKRGSSILWRYYTGPMMLDNVGRPTSIRRDHFKSPKNF